ncbi:hypothetical protein UP10_13415 [Bradyrhizobium sp. LTSPM299]|nr:hypothetical protein UP10_13415 [Bradyrhizobium sp. LTSPM299]
MLLTRPKTEVEIAACWPIMRLLRSQLTSQYSFVQQVLRQRLDGYHLLAATTGGVIVALAGWRIQENFVFGRHVYVDDLVTEENLRGTGLGSHLLTALANECRELRCDYLVLDTALRNTAAQRFYEREDMHKVAIKYIRLPLRSQT